MWWPRELDHEQLCICWHSSIYGIVILTLFHALVLSYFFPLCCWLLDLVGDGLAGISRPHRVARSLPHAGGGGNLPVGAGLCPAKQCPCMTSLTQWHHWRNGIMGKWHHHIGNITQDTLVWGQNSLVKSPSNNRALPSNQSIPLQRCWHDVTQGHHFLRAGGKATRENPTRTRDLGTLRPGLTHVLIKFCSVLVLGAVWSYYTESSHSEVGYQPLCSNILSNTNYYTTLTNIELGINKQHELLAGLSFNPVFLSPLYYKRSFCFKLFSRKNFMTK